MGLSDKDPGSGKLQLSEVLEEKIRANVEVEMLGGPWNDLLTDERPIYEGTDAHAWISAGCPHHTTPDMAIDWLSRP